MAKRGYKLQEFVAHSANVNCIKIGKKTRKHFITGGDDEIVNLWSIGKSTPIKSLSGHTSPIESVAFDSTEVLVAAGASSGVVKLWDLEETKVVRTLNGHRSYCTAVEFHPFGEFFASGSMDTNLRIWDIRKKGCIHTYKGHKRAISTIRFTPDGRWVVSGGLDNVVKIWDLTAGKLLHEFKFHEGHIRSIDFHPLEFLLATGSSDRTVKFWDLETFELIGSTRPEATGVRSINFHPDGRTVFCGLDSSLKVYSWEPVICHDAVDMEWSTLGDLFINGGKLLGCSYYQNSIGVWAADISHIEPYEDCMSADKSTCVESKSDLRESSIERVETPIRSIISPDEGTKDIKNIYVDTAGTAPVGSRKGGSLPKVVNLISPKKIDILPTDKHVPTDKNIEQDSSIFVSGIVPRDNSETENSTTSRRDLVGSDTARNTNFQRRIFTDDAAKDSSKEKTPTSTCVKKEFHKASSPSPLPNENRDGSLDSNEELKSVKCINGVTVVNGRTRSLVKKFEKRDKLNTDECQTLDLATQILPNTDNVPAIEQAINVASCAEPVSKTLQMPEKTPDVVAWSAPEAKTPPKLVKTPDSGPKIRSIQRSIASRHILPEKVRSSPMVVVRRSRASSHMIPERTKTSPMSVVPGHDTYTHMTPEKARLSPLLDDYPQTTGGGLMSKNYYDTDKDLMLDHDLFLSTLQSRVIKLQVVRHFWGRNDIRGAINALQKLPDHAVQADVVSVMMEKTEALTLDLFSCLLPMLLGLLDSDTERHLNISLEMLLTLVALFGPIVSSTISAPPVVGIDLHAEKRLECCNQCHMELQNIHKSLPNVIRRGGLPARRAQELNLILQQS